MRHASAMLDLQEDASARSVHRVGDVLPASDLIGAMDAGRPDDAVALIRNLRAFGDDQVGAGPLHISRIRSVGTSSSVARVRVIGDITMPFGKEIGPSSKRLNRSVMVCCPRTWGREGLGDCPRRRMFACWNGPAGDAVPCLAVKAVDYWFSRHASLLGRRRGTDSRYIRLGLHRRTSPDLAC
jgi:hypothetical protein